MNCNHLFRKYSFILIHINQFYFFDLGCKSERKRGTEGGVKTIEKDREERWTLP